MLLQQTQWVDSLRNDATAEFSVQTSLDDREYKKKYKFSERGHIFLIMSLVDSGLQLFC